MKHTYNRTLFHDDLTEAKIDLYFSEEDRYTRGSRIYGLNDDEEQKITVTGVKSWTVVEGGEEAEALENITEVDENHEYLILNYADGHAEVYRNSHVTMFLW